MPELPEVETIAKDLQKKILNLRVEDITVHDSRMLKGIPVAEFTAALKGRSFTSVTRRGKAILITLDNGRFFVVHVMMTGQLVYTQQLEQLPAVKITFHLSNDSYLHYNDVRLFGRLQIVDDWQTLPYFEGIGPEPLAKDFTINWLSIELKRRKTPIKSLLMDHRFVAGIGNIYASEILYQSCIHPRRRANSLKFPEIEALHKATVTILKTAIKFRGTSMNNYRDAAGQKGKFINRIQVYGRDNEHCPRCQTIVKRIVQGGRSTFYCPTCQSLKVLRKGRVHEATHSC